ncbi:imidazole glycerol phosphate synthase subunit HisH [Salinibacter altiplanensis]|uniref:imidazole glycerol phosphate synthase subunit HisH n=1 Tax=Salinibacter altiplanensis TaxID=1803181 RepID=UPI000C9F78B3|nr:imidazole glycerol phosphate synthase subunit HisH [Salinibacter altiplanensis]
MTTLIDYGIGNLRSIGKALETVGATVHRTDDPAAIRDAERLVLPGVGAFRACIDEIRQRGLEGPIHHAIDRGVPFLGVCVGMQLLFETGHEKGEHEGLGVLPGHVAHFRDTGAGMPEDLSVPHMGWNAITPTRHHPLLDGLGDAPYVYFVHSYHPVADASDDVLTTTAYGHTFPSVVQRDNVFGVQFHPEKSQAAGLGLLENFTALPTANEAETVST